MITTKRSVYRQNDLICYLIEILRFRQIKLGTFFKTNLGLICRCFPLIGFCTGIRMFWKTTCSGIRGLDQSITFKLNDLMHFRHSVCTSSLNSSKNNLHTLLEVFLLTLYSTTGSFGFSITVISSEID